MTTPRWTKNAYVKLILAILVIVCIFTFVLLSNSYKLFGTSSSSSSSALSTEENSEVVETRRSSNLKSLVESWLEGKSMNFNFFSIFLVFIKTCCWCHFWLIFELLLGDLHFFKLLYSNFVRKNFLEIKEWENQFYK